MANVMLCQNDKETKAGGVETSRQDNILMTDITIKPPGKPYTFFVYCNVQKQSRVLLVG